MADASQEEQRPDESTPLLQRRDSSPSAEAEAEQTQPTPKKRSRLQRWPSILALTVLCVAIVVILLGVFLTPEMVQDYAKDALVFEPQSLSVADITDDGIKARLQGNFRMDASKVAKKSVRDIGRFGTWIAHFVETSQASVKVSLPEYGDVLLGTAAIPSLLLNVRNGRTNHIDIISDVRPGPKKGLRRLASDWMDGRLGQLRVQASTVVGVRSGMFTFGDSIVTKSLILKANDIPLLPGYNITHLDVHERSAPGLLAEASINVNNIYPVALNVPPLGFVILAPNCGDSDPRIELARAETSSLDVEPHKDLNVHVKASIEPLPKEVTQVCEGSKKSPLDRLVDQYIRGEEVTMFVRGSPTPKAPQWVNDITSSVTVPIPIKGHSFENIIRNFTLDDVHFDLPDFFAQPGTPQAQPKISGTVKALIGLPEEINFKIDVPRLRSNVDIYYHSDKLGYLDLRKWQTSSSKPVEEDILVKAVIDKAPLNITDNQVFADVVSDMLSGKDKIILQADALVDVELQTALGEFIVRDIPAEGDVPVNPINATKLGSFSPQVNYVRISDTDTHSMRLEASVNFTNPTKYSANVPYLAVELSVNRTVVGHATVEDMTVTAGNNTGVVISALWEPSGAEGRAVGRELLSQYVSGYNTTITVHTFNGTVPSHPRLGEVLSGLEVEVPTPRIGKTDPDDPKPHFIKDTTMHLFSSTATFVLSSPLNHTTIYLAYINATSRYHGDIVGEILYDGFIEIPPGESKTPPLPVDWSLGSVGYGAVKKALGGTLKLNATGTVGIKIGRFEERLWYEGHGIGAKIRL